MNALNYLGLARYCFFKNYPAQVILFVTARCNMKCKMCFYWHNVDNAKASKELTLDEIVSISNNMKPFFWLMVGGGEPFLREDLVEVCALFSRNNKVRNITIPTNGFDVNNIIETVKKMLNRLNNTYLNINFSLDDIGAYHDEIRGVPGAFDKMIKSFKAVKELKKFYSNLGVAINIVYSPLNQEKIFEISDYALNLKPDNLAIVFVRGDTRDRLNYDTDPENYRQLIDKITVSVVKGGLPLYGVPFKDFIYAKDILMRKIIYNTKKTGLYQIPCFAGRISIVISETGEVFPCELKEKSLGNLRNCGYDLSRILTRENVRKLKREIERDRCFCTHECFYTMNILFNLKEYPALFREWIKIKSRKIYAAIK